MGSNRTSDDVIILTDFENDGIFVISSNQHQRIESPNPRISPPPVHVFEEDSQLERSESNHVQEPPPSEFTQYLAQQYNKGVEWLRGKWVALLSYVASCGDWSILQAWNATGYLTCTMPFRLELGSDGKYQTKQNKLQKGIWLIHVLLALVELTRAIPQLITYLNGNPDPFQYIKVADVFVATGARIYFLKTTSSGANHMLRIHDLVQNNFPSQFHSIKKGLTTFCCFVLSIIFILWLNLTTYTYVFYNKWGFNIAELIQAFACYSKETILWQKEEDCSQEVFEVLKDVPNTEILWGVLGLGVYISGVLSQQSMILLILACTLSLLLCAYYCQGVGDGEEEIRQRLAKYDFLKNLSKSVSAYVGVLLTTQLINLACTMPTWMKMMFGTPNPMFLGMTMKVLINLGAFLAACVGAMLIDEMEDEFSTTENSHELPEDSRRRAGFFYRLARKSVGIGYRGLYVLNFRLLFSYLGIIGTFIMVLFKTATEKKK